MPSMIALLGLLAVAGYQNRDKIAEVLRGGQQEPGSGPGENSQPGGQDGALGSAAFLDQIELFQQGKYMQVPLDPATARARYPHRTMLYP